jgi:hypothetical protein
LGSLGRDENSASKGMLSVTRLEIAIDGINQILATAARRYGRRCDPFLR